MSNACDNTIHPCLEVLVGTGNLWLIGLGLAGIWVLSFLVSLIWCEVWGWVDERKVAYNNPLLNIVAQLWGGWKTSPPEHRRSWLYYKGVDFENKTAYTDDVTGVIPPTFFLLLASPLLIIFYEVALFIGTGILIAHLARFARRHKKMFDSHVTDKDAHK